jgi:ubiquinone/menaquinone biosynthesis C-methylase UbiE
VTTDDAADVTERVQAFFDASAPAYDGGYDKPGAPGRLLRRRADVALSLLGEDAGKVLDVGMGAGVLIGELDRRGWEVTGIDLAPSMVERARERLPHVRDRLLQGAIQALPFEDGQFDAVVATGVVEYAVQDLDRAVGELSRVLRTSGALVVSFPNYRAPATLWRAHVLYPVVRVAKRHLTLRRPAPPRMPLVPFERFCEALEQRDLKVEIVEPVGVRPMPARLSRRLEEGRSPLAFRLAIQYVVRAGKGR